MGTPSTRTPIRLGRGTYSNLNASKSDLLEGEVVYAHDQNKLYVKEGSSLETIQADVSGKQDADAQLTELATMSSTTAEALADLTQAEVQILDGCTRTTTQLNYVDATSSIQTQIDGKQASGSYQAADADLTNLAGCQTGASAALAALTQTEVEILDGATLTTTELNYVDGVTSAIQTQLDAKGDAKLATTQTFSGTKSFDAVKVAKGAIHDIGSSPGATITIDFTNGNNQKVTLSADCTFANPTTEVAGQSGSIFIAQPGGANHSITGWGTQFHFAGSDPSNTETNGAVDRLDYIVYEADKIHCVLTKDIAS